MHVHVHVHVHVMSCVYASVHTQTQPKKVQSSEFIIARKACSAGIQYLAC